MNKSELIDAISARVGGNVSKKAVGEVIDAFTDTVADTLKKGDKVSLIGFGTFEARARAARNGRNPRTGATVKIAASKNPAFSAGKALKDTVNS